MASDDEDGDLQRLRALARARQQEALGNGRGQAYNLDQLREKQKRVQETERNVSLYFEEQERPGASSGKADRSSLDEDDEDDDGAGGSLAVDEGEVHEGLRAAFPPVFGRQERKVLPFEAIHSKTKRTDAVSKKDPSRPALQFKLGGVKLPPQETAKALTPVKRSREADFENANSKVSKEIDATGPGRPDQPSVGPPRPSSHEDIDPPRPSGGHHIGPPRPDLIGPPRPSSGEDIGPSNGDSIGPPRPSTDQDAGPSDDDHIGPPRPPDDQDIGPPRPSRQEVVLEKTKFLPDDESGDDDDEGEAMADGEEGYRVPVEHEVVLKGHSRTVSALAVDHNGARVLTGSHDYTVRMYDFGGMDARLKSFRMLEPHEGHQVRALSWSPTADKFLCVTGSAQFKIMDRDGVSLDESVRGDMYIRDVKHTKGHITGCTAGEWHPKDKQTVLTASEDGSIRIWDVNDLKQQKQVIKPRLARPGRVTVTSCKWGPEGKTMAGGLMDGSLQLWHIHSGWGSRPDLFVADAHERDEEISGLCFSADGNTLLSRGCDGTLKVWDLRKFKSPLQTFSDLPNNYGQTNVAFSPDERVFFTGTSLSKGQEGGGRLVFFDKERLQLVRQLGISADSSVVRVLWHSKINQIFATVGNKKEGSTHLLYDPAISERGALSCVARAPRKASIEDFQAPSLVIHNPHALPLFRDAPSRKNARIKVRKDPLKSQRPDLPISGPGHGGRIGTSKGTLLTQYLLREAGLKKEVWMDEDPRAAILSHAEEARNEPLIFGGAYKDTQPKPVFHESDEEEEEEK